MERHEIMLQYFDHHLLIGIAGILSLATAVLHAWGGGVEFHKPMLAGGSSDKLKTGFSVIWHEVTTMLVFNGIALLAAVRNPVLGQGMIWLVLLQFLAFAFLFMFYGRRRLKTFWVLPQWTIFAVLSMLIAGDLYLQMV
jgi:hypothetical protein